MKWERAWELYRSGKLGKGDFIHHLPHLTAENVDLVLGSCPPEIIDVLVQRELDKIAASKIEMDEEARREEELVNKWLRERVFVPRDPAEFGLIRKWLQDRSLIPPTEPPEK